MMLSCSSQQSVAGLMTFKPFRQILCAARYENDGRNK